MRTKPDKRQLRQKDSNGVPLVLRDYILTTGMSQQEAATKMGVSVAALSKWERHVLCPTLEHMKKIEECLKVVDGRLMFPAVWPELIPIEYKDN